MRKVKLKKAGAENFCCYIEPFEISFDENKLILISGPNGVGKSTIFDIVPFTFYGVTTKGARADDVVNTTVGKNCKTWVEFDINDTNYLVERYHKFTKVGSTVILKEKRNGEFVDLAKGHRDVKPIVEGLLIPEKLFMNTLLFGQKVKDFFTDLTDSQQKEIFRKILTLDDYVVYSKIAGDDLNEVSRKISSIEADIRTKGILIDETNSLIKRYTEEKQKFYDGKQIELEFQNTRYRKKEEEVNLLKVSIETYEKMNLQLALSENLSKMRQADLDLAAIVSDTEAKINEVKSKRMLKISEVQAAAEKTKQESYDNLMEALTKIEKLYNEEDKGLLVEISDVKNERDQYRMKITNNSDKIHLMREQLKDFKDSVLEGRVSTCPTCGQTIDERTVNRLKTHVKEIEAKIESLKEDSSQLDVKVIDLQNKFIQLERKRKELKGKSDSEGNTHREVRIERDEESRRKLEELTEKINEVSVQAIDSIRDQAKDKSSNLTLERDKLKTKETEIQDKITEFHELKNSLTRLEADLKGIEEVIKTIEEKEYNESLLNNAIEKVEELVKSIADLEKSLEKEKTGVKILEFWKGAFSSAGIPSMLIDESIPFMNRRIGYYLERIAGGRYIVSFDTLKATKAGEMRDKISVNVLDTKTKANSRVQFSGGQTRLVDIATILTLGDLQNRIHDMQFNVILFDEIFDALDDENINYVSKLLRSLVGDEKSIFIISHRHIDQIDADENLRFL